MINNIAQLSDSNGWVRQPILRCSRVAPDSSCTQALTCWLAPVFLAQTEQLERI